ncbi:hypothetical protein GLOTRDRAFT_48186 [Gloeophyllum trabeum ATCC 11539]|uniref:Uncharacterized protein n=1 Tax=Gloeophyllum trabeum (strain ATCC 11539 / FP-39264 / Madison 617) TaxID=670483 RepID=S7PWY6_GLOTA|nr:uncharacterized protein GLOTRDRAFT_48186 [Gloeophyllum trabeum ATCC 11539]EPQ51897.1 hypothetical protein GLOTRDRAFT_48186 [Gloeophyllum trabeum ATCC 11539]
MLATKPEAVLWTAPLSFSPTVGLVAMRLDETVHYSLGDAHQWDMLIPKGGHVVRVDGPTGVQEPYTVALFHQFKCLDVVRAAVVDGRENRLNASSPLTRHCFNYLRQAILCKPNLRLESLKNATGFASIIRNDLVCNDWTSIYAAAETNHREYARIKNGVTSEL